MHGAAGASVLLPDGVSSNSAPKHVLNHCDSDIAAQIHGRAAEGVDHVVEVSPSKNIDLEVADLKNGALP